MSTKKQPFVTEKEEINACVKKGQLEYNVAVN